MLNVVDGEHTWYFGHLISFIGTMVSLRIIMGWAYTKRDKFVHAVACAVITYGCLHFIKPWWVAPIVAMSIGVGKEVVDLLNKKKQLFDWYDILADLLGTVAVVWVYVFSFLLTW